MKKTNLKTQSKAEMNSYFGTYQKKAEKILDKMMIGKASSADACNNWIRSKIVMYSNCWTIQVPHRKKNKNERYII